MCFEETVKKDAVASVVHSYFNYDMEKCALVDMGEFVDGASSDLAQLLQNKLMEQNKVETEEELNSIGYFDIYNLSAIKLLLQRQRNRVELQATRADGRCQCRAHHLNSICRVGTLCERKFYYQHPYVRG